MFECDRDGKHVRQDEKHVREDGKHVPRDGKRVLLLFLDGVGVGPDDARLNPFFKANLPTLRAALGGALPSLNHPAVAGDNARAFPLDASLDMAGTPQSGTGQTSLLTGENAAKAFGRHFGPWVPVRLRPLLAKNNVLVRARAIGRSVCFANAYPAGFLKLYPRRFAAPPLVAESAGLMTLHAEHLARGEAVASEIVNSGWRERLGHTSVPEILPKAAGNNLAAIAATHDLTFFAHYSTDHAGHRGGMQGAVDALERVDAFIGGILEDLGNETTLLIVSDHGNIEDVSGDHTRNPVTGIEFGPTLGDLRSILDVTPTILSHLDIPGPA